MVHLHTTYPQCQEKLHLLSPPSTAPDSNSEMLFWFSYCSAVYQTCYRNRPWLQHVWFGSVNWALAELWNTNDQPICLSTFPVGAILSLPIANAVICMQCTASYVTATWQNVPDHHCLQTRQIYYNSICSSWALFSVLCYSLHTIQNNNYMLLWHCSTEFLRLKKSFPSLWQKFTDSNTFLLLKINVGFPCSIPK